MGSCASKQKKAQKSFTVLSIPQFTYVNRKSNLVLSVSSAGSSRLDLQGQTVFLPGSLIANYNEKTIFLISGEKSNKKQTKKCFQIDLVHNSVTQIQSLPKSIPNLSKAEVVIDSQQVLVIPTDKFAVWAYNVNKNTWTSVEVEMLKSGLTHLRDFSCCKFNDNIMVITGRYSKTEFSNDIYCVGINKQDGPIYLFDLKFPGELFNAKSICTKEYKIVGGGVCANGELNTKFYIKPNKEDWNSFSCESFRVLESYPPMVVQNVPIFISGYSVMACIKGVIVNFPMPGGEGQDLREKGEKAASHEANTDKEISIHEGKKQEKTESDEESAPVYSRSISDLSGSYVLKARILTPVNQTFRETISSYDSDFSSQKLFSDDEEEQIILNNEDPANVNNTEDPPTAISKPVNSKPSKSEYQTQLNILHQKHSIEVLLEYDKVEEFLLFLVDLFKIKNFRLPSSKPKKFSLYELEGILRKLRFKLYPIETFKLIIKSLDILFAVKKSITKEERNMLKKIAGMSKRGEFVQKDNLINAVAFRIKLAVIGVNI